MGNTTGNNEKASTGKKENIYKIIKDFCENYGGFNYKFENNSRATLTSNTNGSTLKIAIFADDTYQRARNIYAEDDYALINMKDDYTLILLKKNKGLLGHSKNKGWTWGNSDNNLVPLSPQPIAKGYNKIKNDIEEIIKEKFNISRNPNANDLRELLEKSHQMILQGPPGTGKTRMAKLVADNMVDNNEERIRLVQFHPALGYEDIISGIGIESKGTKLLYSKKAGIIKEFADDIKSKNNKDEKFVLIIDEINRAPMASVLGELLYALERRGEEVKLLDGETITIPDNLYIIGTMNTADKTIASMDYALRRRFAFAKILSEAVQFDNIVENNGDKYTVEFDGNKYIFEKALYNEVSKFFTKETVTEGIDPEDIKLGASYFLYKNNDKQVNTENRQYKIKYQIIPTLQEYNKDGLFRRNVYNNLYADFSNYINDILNP